MNNQAKISSARKFLKGNFYGMKPERLSKLTPKTNAQDQTGFDDAWNLYTGALTKFINGGANWPNLQLVALDSLEEKLNWDDPNFGDYYFHKISADLINGPGATYIKTAKSFSERYGLFIQDIQIPAVDMDALKKATDALTLENADLERHSELVDNLNQEWLAYDTRQRNSVPPNLWKTFDQWWSAGPQDIYNNSLQLQLTYYQNYQHWEQVANNGGETISEILKAYDPKLKKLVKLPTNSSNSQIGGVTEVYPYQISEDYSTWLQAASSGQLARTTLTINKNSYRSDISQSSISAGIGIGFGFFGVIAAGNRKTVQVDTTTVNFSMNFDGVFKTFQVIPGEWYNSSAFDLYRQGPFFPPSQMEHLYEMNGIFGPNGFLSFMPSQAVVVYNPKLTLTFDSDTYHYFDQVTQGFAAFCIGPFAIGGGSYYDHKTTVTNDPEHYTFTIEIKDYAILLAFNSQAI